MSPHRGDLAKVVESNLEPMIDGFSLATAIDMEPARGKVLAEGFMLRAGLCAP